MADGSQPLRFTSHRHPPAASDNNVFQFSMIAILLFRVALRLQHEIKRNEASALKGKKKKTPAEPVYGSMQMNAEDFYLAICGQTWQFCQCH